MTKKVLIALLPVFLLSGCVVLRNLTGDSFYVLERTKDYAVKETLDYSPGECIDKVLSVIKEKMADSDILKIDRRRNRLLLLVVRPSMEENDDIKFTLNSADVALFFTAKEQNKTEVEINSLSSIFVDYTKEIIFSQLKPAPAAGQTTEELQQLEEMKELEWLMQTEKPAQAQQSQGAKE
jgi:hypothetical protein